MYICSMGTVDLRNKLQELMQYANDKDLANAFDEFVKVYKNEKEIVAHTVQGKPLTKEMYIQKVKEADASVEAGSYTTMEDLEKEMLNW